MIFVRNSESSFKHIERTCNARDIVFFLTTNITTNSIMTVNDVLKRFIVLMPAPVLSVEYSKENFQFNDASHSK